MSYLILQRPTYGQVLASWKIPQWVENECYKYLSTKRYTRRNIQPPHFNINTKISCQTRT